MNSEEANEHYQAGLRLIEARDWTGAVEELRQAVRLEPSWVAALYGLGYVLAEMTDFEGAILQFERALEFEPDNVHVVDCLGGIYLTMRDWPTASRYLQRALELGPDNASPLAKYGHLLIKSQQDVAQGLQHLARARELDPNSPIIHLMTGLGLYKLELYSEAVASFQKALRLNPDYPDALNALGCCYLKMERYDEARSLYQQALLLKPDFPQAYHSLAKCLCHSGDPKGALRVIEEGLQYQPSNEKLRDAWSQLQRYLYGRA